MAELLARQVGAGDPARRVSELQRAAVAVREGKHVSGRRRPVGALIAGAVHRQGAHGLAVEASPEADHLVLAGGVLGQAEGALHRLRAARVELHAVDARGRQPGHFVDQVGAGRAGEATHRGFFDLRVQRFPVGGMAVPQRVHPDAADQVDVPVPVHVLDHRSLRALDGDAAHQCESLQPRREVLLLLAHELPALGPGNLRLDVGRGELHADLSCRKPLRRLRFPTFIGNARAPLHCQPFVSKVP